MVKKIATIGGQGQPRYDQRSITKDGIILAAMAVISLAFGIGLYEQVGLNIILCITFGAIGFFVLFSLHYIVVQLSSSESLVPRISSLERVASRLARDISKVDEMSREMKEFRETIERIDRAQSQLELGGFGESFQQREEATYKLNQDVRRIERQIQALKDYFEQSHQENKARIKSELLRVENHIKQTTDKFMLQSPEPRREIPTSQPNADLDMQFSPVRQVQKANLPKSLMPNMFGDTSEPLLEFPSFPSTSDTMAPAKTQPSSNATANQKETLPDVHFSPIKTEKQGKENRLLDIIQGALGNDRVDLYLQPIVNLPSRDVAYYEAFTRLRAEDDTLLLPSTYIEFAEKSGAMPVIDNIMLFRSIQVMRRLLERGSAKGLFCNISPHSLCDDEFYTEFITFMEKNKDLSNSLFFDISQNTLNSKNPRVMDFIGALLRMGYRFSLDKVTNLDIDFARLQNKGFQFIKIDSHILLNGMEGAGARIHIADMTSYLARYGLDLIAEKIENETSLTQLISYNITLGQGHLFSEPRPVRSEIFKNDKSRKAA